MRCLLATLFEVVVMVAEESSLTAAVARLMPELAVVDLSLAKGDLSGLIGRLRKASPDLKILFLGDDDSASVAASILAKGADGLLIKHSVAATLLDAVAAVRRGERVGGQRRPTIGN